MINPYQPMLNEALARIKPTTDPAISEWIEGYMRDWLLYGIEPLPLAAPWPVTAWEEVK